MGLPWSDLPGTALGVLIAMYSRESEIKADETYELPLCYVLYRMVQAAELQNAWKYIYEDR